MRTQQSISILLATAGGLGRMPVAPGTWGSVLGVLIGFVSLRFLPFRAALILLIVSFGLCVLVCTQAERQMNRHDPSAVILDEVWGMWAILVLHPRVLSAWWMLVAAFVFFRIFDIVKPPPLNALARLPRGLGIMADDLGAAYYALLILWVLSKVAH